MEISCPVCSGTGQIEEESCTTCGGGGAIDLTDASFRKMSMHPAELMVLMGTIWDSMLTSLADIRDKCNDIFEKVNE